MKNNKGKIKVLAWILALMLALPALAGVAALADDVHVYNETKVVTGDVDGQASVYAEGAEASLTVTGSVTDNGTAVSVNTDDGGSATLEAGNVTTENTDPEYDPSAVGVFTNDDKDSADVLVGDVTSSDSGVAVGNNGGTIEVTTGDIEADEDGLNVYAGNKSEWTSMSAEEFSTLELGDVNNIWNDGETLVENFAGEGGVWYYRYSYPDGTFSYGKSVPVDSKGTTTVETGSVTVIDDEDHWTQAVSVNANAEDQTVNVTVNGNVIADNNVTTESVQGVNVWANEGTANLTVNGDITVNGGEWSNTAQANIGEDGGTVNLTVNGEIYAESNGGNGLSANLNGDGTITVDADEIYVESTGEEGMTGVNVNPHSDDSSVTVTTGEITADGTGVNVYNAGGEATVTTGAITAGRQGVWASAGENNDWDWMHEDEFAALNLGAPTLMDSWTNSDGVTVMDEQYAAGDNVIYHHYIYSNGQESFEKQTITPSEGFTTVTVNGDVTVKAEKESDYWVAGVGGNTSGETQKNDQTVVIAVNGNVSVTNAKGEGQGVQAEAHDGDTTITIDGNTDVSAKQYVNGVSAYASGESTATATINGDVTTESTDGFAQGVGLSAYEEDSSAKVTVNGDVTATSDAESAVAVAAYVSEDGYAEAYINGDVTAKGDIYSAGIRTDNFGGIIDIEVVGDIESSGVGMDLVDVMKTEPDPVSSGDYPAFNEAEFLYTDYGENGTADVYCHEENGQKIYYYATKDGNVYFAYTEKEVEAPAETRVEVKGDVEGETKGVIIELENDKGKMDLIVDGTISGETSSVVVSKETISDNLIMTVWEIKANDAGNVVERTVKWTEGDDGEWTETREADRELEKKIQYIIRLEQPTTGSISTSGTTEYEGYDVAKEGDKVVLKLNIPSGYKVTDAFNGTDVKVSLLKDENGDYYLIVPKGGAVNLSVTLEKIPAAVPTQQQQQQKTKMSDEEITTAVEAIMTENAVAEDSTVTVEQSAGGTKTVVITPKETAAEGSSAKLTATCSSDLLKELQTSDVKEVQIVSKSGTASVTLEVKDAVKATGAEKGSNLVVDIEENTAKIDSAKQALAADYQVLDGAVSVTAKIVDSQGNAKALEKANIKIRLTLKKVDGMKIMFVDEQGNVHETDAKWVEEADGVPGHWEVAYMGEGTFMAVVAK